MKADDPRQEDAVPRQENAVPRHEGAVPVQEDAVLRQENAAPQPASADLRPNPSAPQPEDDDILEDNLRRLFAVSYLPIAPSASFKSRLEVLAEERAAAEFARRPTRRASSLGSRLLRRNPARLFAAAVLLVLVGATVVYALLQRGGPATQPAADPILASGSVALHARTETGWRVLDAREAAHGLDVAGRSLEIATPSGRGARLVVGTDAVIEIAADTRASIAAEGTQASFALERGALTIERSAAGRGWTISAHGGEVSLELGRLEARVEEASAYGGIGSCLVARLERGVASADIGGTGTPLSPGIALALQNGRALTASVDAISPDEVSMRESIAPAVAGDANPPKTAGEPRHATERVRITGVVHVAEGVAMPPRFTVTLLRRERGPALAEPVVRVFEGTSTFALEGVRPGPHELFVEAEGFAVWRKEPLDVKGAGANTTAANDRAVEVVLERGATLRGRVVDAVTGAPIDEAWVVSEDDVPAQLIPFSGAGKPWLASTRTRADGTFELGGVAAKSQCRLRASHPGYGAAWTVLSESDSEAGSAIEFRLEVGGSIEGHVLHDDGTPWANTTIAASPLGKPGRMTRMSYGTSSTDAEGHYKIEDLPSGAYIVLNAVDARRPRNDAAPTQTHVESGQTTTLDLPVKITGTRVECSLLGKDGAVISDLDVQLQPQGQRALGGWRSQRARRDGRFTFQGIAPGKYDVFVGRGMSSAWQAAIEVPDGPEFRFEVRLDEGSIHGRAVMRDGQALPGPNFLLLEVQRDGRFEFAGRGVADEKGRFRFDRLRPGAYRATVFPMERGLAPTSSGELWIANADSSVECELAIEPGAALRVKVVDADGAAVAGAAVTFVDEDGRAMHFTPEDVTDASGTLPIPGLHPGSWTIGATRGGRSAGPVVLELFAGEEREVVIEFAR